ncbi:MAG: hypothetical protein JXP34_12860, partial [Planctomycetes bacterium]|nr:hypothetical protein [Planctomycetota bacterium]
ATGEKCPPVCCKVAFPPCPECPCISNLACDPLGAGPEVALAWTLAPECADATFRFTVDGNTVTPSAQTPTSARVKVDPPCGTHTICVIAILPDGTECPPVCCRVEFAPCPECPCILDLVCDPMADVVFLGWTLAAGCEDVTYAFTLDGSPVVPEPGSATPTTAKIKVVPYCGTHRICVIAILPDGTKCPEVCCTVNLPACPECPCASNLRCDVIGAGPEVALVWDLDPRCADATFKFTVDGDTVPASAQTPTSARVKVDPPCGTHTICVIAILPDGTECDPVCCRVELSPCPECPCIADLVCDPMADAVALAWTLVAGCEDATLEFTVDGNPVVPEPGSATPTTAEIKIVPYCGSHRICVTAILADGTKCPPVCCTVNLAPCPECPCIENLACDPVAGANEVVVAWALAAQCADATFEFTLDANPVAPISQTPTMARIKIEPYCGTHRICVVAILPDGTRCDPVCCTVELPPCPECPCASNLRCDVLGAGPEVVLVWDLAPQCADATFEFTVDAAPVVPISQAPTTARIKVDPPCGTRRICVIVILPDGTKCPPVCCTVELEECPDITFIRADTDGNGMMTIGDGVQILERLFADRPAFGSNCDKTGDFDDDGILTIGDAISVFNLLFASGRDPNPPYPGCGGDSTPDLLTCEGPVPACP